jgi:hypothetical protein
MIGDARKSIAMLEDRLKAGAVSAATIARLQELTGGGLSPCECFRVYVWRALMP